MTCPRNIILLSAMLMCLFALRATATPGAQPLLLTEIPHASGVIKMDGSLDGWADARVAVFSPLAGGLSPEMQRAGVVHRAAVRACYDEQALYLAVDWQGKPPAVGGAADAFAVHMLTDRLAHFTFTPPGVGAPQHIRLWYARSDEAVDAGAQGARAVETRSKDQRSSLREIRLPWTSITRSGKPPADGRVRLLFDFSWGDLTPETIGRAPLTSLHAQKFITVGLLTSPEKLFDTSGYLPSPANWGNLQFAAQLTPNETQQSEMATGATVTYAAPAAQPPAMDGALRGWDPALFQQFAYAPGYLGERYNGKIAVMYDAEHLYIALHSHTGAGLYNVEHESMQQGFWGGDNLQIRLNDGKRTVNLCAWQDSTTGQPALTADGRPASIAAKSRLCSGSGGLPSA